MRSNSSSGQGRPNGVAPPFVNFEGCSDFCFQQPYKQKFTHATTPFQTSQRGSTMYASDGGRNDVWGEVGCVWASVVWFTGVDFRCPSHTAMKVPQKHKHPKVNPHQKLKTVELC
eukprot:TRINITY_DN68537_c0_g1_i1.p1 TRINITY_DN68537_c0_g1~~TRINITY_DN68537_c0_g1_i1.p1  ORF type:complete len:115 (-),score=12.47 TRINITY_DN68537_c0_g1_i1:65-409(-)